ncbi:hypothetical protein Misp01_15460 [Microtetraspora sp. NBRC 13810]|uniref:hypothetical protein n=1 Tax=Microtetraspora sp. NBRC 13810 TaxID=3030990 RepID=UPI0024A104D9|nr:hypothetical protein [Microtetraspora sp. NBRC 13810]GLW06416.1 hypothetical protein Misp01_15460 [Microtetraspora sp. NBRC 13810]
MSRGPSAFRLLRAVVFATVCVAISAGGHLLAGGGPIRLGVGVLAAAGAFGLAYALNGRDRGPEVVLPATMATQLLLHELFSWHAPAPPAQLTGGHAHPGVGMALIHVVVGLLTGWWLYRGDSALWLLVRVYGVPPLRVRPPLAVPPAQAPPRVRRAGAGAEPPRLCGRVIPPAAYRRGPPEGVRAA